MKKIKVFSMFAGYGGDLFALKKANIPYELIGFSEIAKYAIQIHNQNHPNGKNYGDCTKINPNDLPNFNLLTAGFPCLDASFCGKRDITKGRTMLFTEIIRIAKVKTPKYLLLENVKEFVSIDRGKTMKYLIRELQQAGYGVIYKVLNSKNHGIPQKRERIWFVCKYGGFHFNEFQFPYKVKLAIFLKDLLEKEVDKKYFVSKGQLNRLLNSSDIKKKFSVINPIIAHTQTARQYANYKGTFIKNDRNEIRRLTPMECFRIQGFLDDKINLKTISDNQLYALAGNGWEINVVSKIFQNIYKIKN